MIDTYIHMYLYNIYIIIYIHTHCVHLETHIMCICNIYIYDFKHATAMITLKLHARRCLEGRPPDFAGSQDKFLRVGVPCLLC